MESAVESILNISGVVLCPYRIIGSAGIGRTGMLILMDTALSLLQMNEPIYPLDILKNMRDQRPCMVQNVVSIYQNVAVPNVR